MSRKKRLTGEEKAFVVKQATALESEIKSLDAAVENLVAKQVLAEKLADEAKKRAKLDAKRVRHFVVELTIKPEHRGLLVRKSACGANAFSSALVTGVENVTCKKCRASLLLRASKKRGHLIPIKGFEMMALY